MPAPFADPYPTRPGTFKARTLRSVLAMALLLGAPVAAQSPGIPTAPGMATPRMPIVDPSILFGDNSMEARQAKLLNIQRQKTIVTDAEKILQLARELNTDANSANPSMSVAQRVQKAEEIEKLAKAVREKMTYAIAAPASANPYAPWRSPE